jgi:hypothetical protein
MNDESGFGKIQETFPLMFHPTVAVLKSITIVVARVSIFYGILYVHI